MPRSRALPLILALLLGVSTAGAATGTSSAASKTAPARRAAAPALAVTFDPIATSRPGTPVVVSGVLRTRSTSTGRLGRPVAGSLALRVRNEDRTLLRRLADRVTTDRQGRFRTVLPATATLGVTPPRSTGFRETLALDALDVRSGSRTVAQGAGAGAAAVAVSAPPRGLQVEASYVSPVGWVKPGEEYPFRVRLTNASAAPANNVTVTVPAVTGMAFVAASPATSTAGRASTSPGRITWTVPTIGAGSVDAPRQLELVVAARALSLGDDPRVVWRNLSVTATARSAAGTSVSTTHGPKVIPPGATYDTARYGDRPFPVVPVDYADYKHGAGRAPGASSGSKLDAVLNDPAKKGSLFNLWQENSLGQLYVQADVPSAGIATRAYNADSDKLRFSTIGPTTTNSCNAATVAANSKVNPVDGTPLPTYTTRISDGWYQLPQARDYYGDDANGSALVGAVGGVGALQNIDAGCGPTAKMAYDAAVLADPEIDYSDFDTNKDGVVDFFEVIFQGLGGNGVSQGLGCDNTNATNPDQCPTGEGSAPYDNVWPHSSSLEGTYTDPATGLKGYITKDQLRDYDGKYFWYTDTTRTRMTKTDMGPELRAFVRVGPYNVNPESAIAKTSVVAHEYAHSLGSPDYYSTGSRETYGDWSVSATDKMQNESGFETQELGWIVPEPLPAGTSTLSGFTDTKVNTKTIKWRTPSGQPYTLTGPSVNNAKAYTAKLPGKKLIDPKKVAAGASGKRVWWSTSGNDFGCPPATGKNFDIDLSALKKVPSGTTVTLTFNSAFEIEWDYDYGFVMVGQPDSKGLVSQYTSLPSANGTTTPSTVNPNQNGCQSQYGNGITGSSQSYKDNTQTADRVLGNYPDYTFLKDSFDLSSLAGKGGVLRFSYSTDPGLAKAGWFIDDVTVKAGNQVIYASDFEKGQREPQIANGGCSESGLRLAAACTPGWQYVDSALDNPADVGYYLTMRDRSGFDYDSRGQNDRAPIGFAPGLLLEYTDEGRGYGNTGGSDPPPQSPLDARPEPGSDTPNLDDAAFNAGESFADTKWVDNYTDPTSASGNWEFNAGCLSFEVLSMKGDDDPTARSGSTVTGLRPGVPSASDLSGNVKVTTTPKCAPFSYGFASARVNAAPRAVAEAKPTRVRPGEQVTLNGSRSWDDNDASSALTYAWDFNDDGRTDATGATVRRAFEQEGRQQVRLKVTDSRGLTSTTSTTVVVSRSAAAPTTVRPRVTPPGAGQLASTGASATVGLLALALLAAAAGGRRWSTRPRS